MNRQAMKKEGGRSRNAEHEILYLQVDQLVPDRDNPRRFYLPEDLQAMADSIREAGHPVCAPARCQAGQV